MLPDYKRGTVSHLPTENPVKPQTKRQDTRKMTRVGNSEISRIGDRYSGESPVIQ